MDKEAIARIVQNALLKTPRRGNVETWVAAGEVATAILALQSSERGVERMFVLEWIAAPRPPVHPEPMRGRREFPSIEKVAEFVNNLPDDAEIDSLIEHATAKINRTAQLNAATLSPAEPPPESREEALELLATATGDRDAWLKWYSQSQQASASVLVETALSAIRALKGDGL